MSTIQDNATAKGMSEAAYKKQALLLFGLIYIPKTEFLGVQYLLWSSSALRWVFLPKQLIN